MFRRFQKAFDSVWHEGMFLYNYRLLKYGIGGKMYKSIKSLHSKSVCAVKLDNHKTNPFDYYGGVRQGCILSQFFSIYFEMKYLWLFFQGKLTRSFFLISIRILWNSI